MPFVRFQNVCLEGFGCTLPDEIVSSADIEAQLSPLYERLRLPPGRLELMTGIRERRFWPAGTLPGEMSVRSAEQAIQNCGIDRKQIGALVHGSVCRDHLEPATACSVHHRLGLSNNCAIYDVSNACLGLLNGMVQVANMIELGQIHAGLVVGSEGGRQLVETTIAALNADQTLTRSTVKNAVASLTIGSASAAVLLTHRSLSRTGHRLLGGVMHSNTAYHKLCHSGADEAVASGMQPLMQTDSEQLMQQGVAAGAEAFQQFLAGMEWSVNDIQRTFCHQVGVAHRKLTQESLGLNPAVDFSTVEWLGNTGAAALPVTMALGIEENPPQTGDKIAMLGIGSGINVLMLGVEW
ncbi:MAG: 3-oxoacyl-ACP synthase III [Planctomycetota bacterium]|nr:3-oxoacyl-ACP synthase III [Planctomycetota bacterium]